MNIIMLIAITLVAFSVAINSEGPIKMTLSYVIASALLILSIMTMSLNWDKLSNKQDSIPMEEPVTEVLEPEPEPEPIPVAVKPKKPAVDQRAVAKFMKDGKYWINKGIHWSKMVNSFNLDDLDDMDDDQYEVLIAEAKKYHYKAATVYKKIKSLKAPTKGTKALKAKLQSAGKTLNLAGSKLLKFFSAEDEDEEDKFEEEFISLSKASLTAFNRLNGSF